MVFLKSLLSSSLGLKSLPWKDHSGNWSSESIRINCQVNRKESALERPERLQGFRGKKAGKAAHSPGSRCTCPLKTDVLSRSTWEGRLKTKLKHRSGLTKAEVCWVYEFPRAAITNYCKQQKCITSQKQTGHPLPIRSGTLWHNVRN